MESAERQEESLRRNITVNEMSGRLLEGRLSETYKSFNAISCFFWLKVQARKYEVHHEYDPTRNIVMQFAPQSPFLNAAVTREAGPESWSELGMD